MPPNSSFSIILPSNTPSEPTNRSNKFVVQLPRKLVFPGSGWVVGLTNIIYPNSWSTIDAVNRQFLYLHLKDGRRFRLPLPSGVYLTPEELEKGLHGGMIKDLEKRTGISYKRQSTTSLTAETAKRQKRDAATPQQQHEPPLLPQSWGDLTVTERAFKDTLTENEQRFLYALRAQSAQPPPPALTRENLNLIKELRALREGGFAAEELYIVGTHPSMRKGKEPVDDVSTITTAELYAIKGIRSRRWNLREPPPLDILDSDNKLDTAEMRFLDLQRVFKGNRIVGAPYTAAERELISKLRRVSKWRISELELALVAQRRRRRKDPIPVQLRGSLTLDDLNVILDKRETEEARSAAAEAAAQQQQQQHQQQQQQQQQQRKAAEEAEQRRKEAENRQKAEAERHRKEAEERAKKSAVQQQQPKPQQPQPQTQTESDEALKARVEAPYSYLDNVTDHTVYSHIRWASRGKGAEKLLIYGVDPLPRLHHLSEKDGDGHLFAVAAEKFAKHFNLNRVDRDFLIKAEQNIEDFERFYAEAEGAEDFAHLNTNEKQQLLQLAHSVRFAWDEDLNRFVLHLFETAATEAAAELLDFVSLSEQIAAVLGFEDDQEWIYPNTTAKYPPDLHGGVSHLGIYLNGGVMEAMIVGDRQTDLLQMIAVSGKPGDIVERNFQSPLFHPVIAREVSRLTVEIRSTSGRLVPFSYGEVILTLQFKKTISF